MSKKKAKKTFKTLMPGEWAYLRQRGHKMKCCDCGLVHKMDFVISNMKGDILNKVQIAFRAYRTKK